MNRELVETLKRLMTAHCDVNGNDHDNKYYTKTQLDEMLGTGGNGTGASHNHTKEQITDLAAWAKADNKPAYTWSEITEKPSVFPVASHNHDGTYLSLTGGTVTGDITIDNGHNVIVNALATTANYDAGMTFKHLSNASASKVAKIGAIGGSSAWDCIRIGFADLSESTSSLQNLTDGLLIYPDEIKWNGKRLLTTDDKIDPDTVPKHNHDSEYLKLAEGTTPNHMKDSLFIDCKPGERSYRGIIFCGSDSIDVTAAGSGQGSCIASTFDENGICEKMILSVGAYSRESSLDISDSKELVLTRDNLTWGDYDIITSEGGTISNGPLNITTHIDLKTKSTGTAWTGIYGKSAEVGNYSGIGFVEGSNGLTSVRIGTGINGSIFGDEALVITDNDVTFQGKSLLLENVENLPSHNHTKEQITDLAAWAKADNKPAYTWSEITEKPSVFPVASHNHDDSYLKLSGGEMTGDIRYYPQSDNSFFSTVNVCVVYPTNDTIGNIANNNIAGRIYMNSPTIGTNSTGSITLRTPAGTIDNVKTLEIGNRLLYNSEEIITKTMAPAGQSLGNCGYTPPSNQNKKSFELENISGWVELMSIPIECSHIIEVSFATFDESANDYKMVETFIFSVTGSNNTDIEPQITMISKSPNSTSTIITKFRLECDGTCTYVQVYMNKIVEKASFGITYFGYGTPIMVMKAMNYIHTGDLSRKELDLTKEINNITWPLHLDATGDTNIFTYNQNSADSSTNYGELSLTKSGNIELCMYNVISDTNRTKYTPLKITKNSLYVNGNEVALLKNSVVSEHGCVSGDAGWFRSLRTFGHGSWIVRAIVCDYTVDNDDMHKTDESYMFIVTAWGGGASIKLLSKNSTQIGITKVRTVYKANTNTNYYGEAYIDFYITSANYSIIFDILGTSCYNSTCKIYTGVTASIDSGFVASKELDLTVDNTPAGDSNEWKQHSSIEQTKLTSTLTGYMIHMGQQLVPLVSKYTGITYTGGVINNNASIGYNNQFIFWNNASNNSQITSNYIFGAYNIFGSSATNNSNTYGDATKLNNCYAIGTQNIMNPGYTHTILIGHYNHAYRMSYTTTNPSDYQYNTVIGYMNSVGDRSSSSAYGDSNIYIYGKNNSVGGSSTCFIIGESNSVKNQYHVYVMGYNNKFTTANRIIGCGVIGHDNILEGQFSYAIGSNLRTRQGQTIIGHYNDTQNTQNSVAGTSTGTAFMIGNGTASTGSNAFRVTGDGKLYAASSTVNTGADYAEYFEYADGNLNDEDRVGYFITFDSGRLIRIANSNDDFILGISSGNPVIIGNGDECWSGRFERDHFDRYIIENTTDTIHMGTDDDGNDIVETIPVTKWKENEKYNPDEKYIQRCDRPEWEAVGMLGILAVYDNGECTIDGYCTVGDGGIAIPCEYQWGPKCYRVLERLSNNIVRVLFRN